MIEIITESKNRHLICESARDVVTIATQKYGFLNNCEILIIMVAKQPLM